MHAGIDPDHRLAFGGQRTGLRVVELFGLGQLCRDGAVVVQLGEVLG